MKNETVVERISSPAPGPFLRPSKAFIVTDFQVQNPLCESSQAGLLDWLVQAHVQSDPGVSPEQIRQGFMRYGCSSDKISRRRHEPLRLGAGIREKIKFFDESVARVFTRFYPHNSSAPKAIVHVTCTGYRSPSGAQRLVSSRGWGKKTEVYHAYHMGCYASHPAIRMATGLVSSGAPVDVVHTELCSLHLDPGRHDPAQLIVQSLFSDGFIKYSLARASGHRPAADAPSLEILHMREEIVPGSEEAMVWSIGPLVYEMTLAKEVPVLLAQALPAFVRSLFEGVGLDYSSEKDRAVFAVHPGGPRILDACQRILDLDPRQLEISREVLFERGNMSSATLPHIWKRIADSEKVPEGSLIVSVGAGPGLTLVGGLFRKI